MGGSAGGALAAAVSNGGGLGLLGGGPGDPAWLARELPVVAAGTDRPWGVGFQSWAVDVGTVEQALQFSPRAVMLSFGDPRPFIGPIRDAGAVLIIQATDLDEARQAVDLGRRRDRGPGNRKRRHGARRGQSTLPFVPIVVDLAAPVPVLAAGGIADGRTRGRGPGGIDYTILLPSGLTGSSPLCSGEPGHARSRRRHQPTSSTSFPRT